MIRYAFPSIRQALPRGPAAALCLALALALVSCRRPPPGGPEAPDVPAPPAAAVPAAGTTPGPATTKATPAAPAKAESILPGGPDAWRLEWSDEFDGGNTELDRNWASQNGPSGHILCSRWRENAVIGGGMLRLINRKEKRGGQAWTSGNLWTRTQFLYGYFECRYRYAAAEGTNNSFWLMTQGPSPTVGKRFEIDINEGHFPNEVNTNIHNWSDFFMENGKKRHHGWPRSFPLGLRPDRVHELESPVTARRLRFSSRHQPHFHLGEFRIFAPNPAGYPDPKSREADSGKPGLVNHARAPGVRVTASGTLKPDETSSLARLTDGNPKTTWISQAEGEKWVEFDFGREVGIGCIQFLNGWVDKGRPTGMIRDYRIERHDGTRWIPMAQFDLADGETNLARTFHTYGLEWSETELVFYFDGKELRREKNEFCFSPSPIWLSLAIIPWAGKVTDAIDGTFMEVDHVRVFRRRTP